MQYANQCNTKVCAWGNENQYTLDKIMHMSKDWKEREKNTQIAHRRNISVITLYRIKKTPFEVYLYIWNSVIKIAKKLFLMMF